MAEDDIYKSKQKYETVVNGFDSLIEKPTGKSKYFCKNKKNIKYFKGLVKYFDLKDLSYIRRRKVLYIMRLITFVIKKDLKDCEREDVNELVAFGHERFKTITSKKDFIKDVKVIWRVLFPEKDNKGRIDETLTPYAVRHLSNKIDKSKEKLRNDRISLEEFEAIVKFYDNDPKMQAYLTLAFESLGRPQEILYTKIKDYEFYDNYARIWISEHGKEGCGFLQCIDSLPYVLNWYRNHPLKGDKDAFFFISENNRAKYGQLKNHNINQRLKHACKVLGIDKNITCYSLKRNGITHRRIRGDSDTEIQHAARWTSTRQLKIYDMSTQEDALKIALKKRGFVEKESNVNTESKKCVFCGQDNGFSEEFCSVCKRPLDRDKLREQAQMHERLMQNNIVQKLDKMEQMFGKMKKM
ncbi:MAG: site-specific integrase [archaeon]